MDQTHIIALLIDIKGTVGELKEAARNGKDDRLEMKKLLEDHVSVDLSVAARVTSLEHSRTRMRGMVVATAAIVSGVITVAGIIVKMIA